MRRSRLGILAITLAAGALFAVPLQAEINVKETSEAISGSLDWLADQQKENGAWSNDKFPALTAMPLQAFLDAEHPRKASVVSNALAYILTCVQDDGGIYVKSIIPGRGGLGVYNTAVCMTALHAANTGDYTDIILAARKYLADAQLTGDDNHAGGFGYGPAGWRRSTDLNNTLYAARAMRITQGYEDQRPSGQKRVALDWDGVVEYLDKMQNDPEDGASEAGGFYYAPGRSGAGKTENAAGEVVFRSYGSMTYVGLLAMIYADLPRTDHRVKSAVDWAANHWTLDENPGIGQQGMYFFYNVLTRALAAHGGDTIPRDQGGNVQWKTAVAEKLLALRRTDENGYTYWVNETGRYWENDPVLVTAYCIRALQALSATGN